jgi:hypothetical protein
LKAHFKTFCGVLSSSKIFGLGAQLKVKKAVRSNDENINLDILINYPLTLFLSPMGRGD